MKEREHSQACRAGDIPREDKKPHKSPYEDANEYVSIIRHSQQHQYVRDRKLQREDARANSLLTYSWDMTSSSRLGRLFRISKAGGEQPYEMVLPLRRRHWRCLRSGGHITLPDQAIVFALQAAQELEQEHEADDADA